MRHTFSRSASALALAALACSASAHDAHHKASAKDAQHTGGIRTAPAPKVKPALGSPRFQCNK